MKDQIFFHCFCGKPVGTKTLNIYCIGPDMRRADRAQLRTPYECCLPFAETFVGFHVQMQGLEPQLRSETRVLTRRATASVRDKGFTACDRRSAIGAQISRSTAGCAFLLAAGEVHLRPAEEVGVFNGQFLILQATAGLFSKKLNCA